MLGESREAQSPPATTPLGIEGQMVTEHPIGACPFLRS